MFLILPIHASTLSMLIGDIKLVNGKWSQSVSLFLQWSIDWLRGSLYAVLSGFELVVILSPLPPRGCNHRCVLPCLASFILFWTGNTAQQKICEEKQKRKINLQVFAGALAQRSQCWKRRRKKERRIQRRRLSWGITKWAYDPQGRCAERLTVLSRFVGLQIWTEFCLAGVNSVFKTY